MAEVVDAEDFKREATLVEGEEYGNLEETAESPEVSAPEPEEDLPEKYRGKSPAEIARMHQELEKRLGQQSEEVGQLRTAFDEYIKTAVSKQATPAPEVPEVDETDFWTDPRTATQRMIESSPEMQQLRAVAAEMKKSQSLASLQAAHPDMKEVLSDPGFKEWVGKSQIRKQLYHMADQQYDFDAANELLSTYKERKGVVQQTKQVEAVAQKNEIKKASTGSVRTNPNGTSTKKVYRRTDIIELMKTNPKRYNDLLPEIMKAYQEGRVK